MEERIAFDQYLFGDGKEININDIEFFVDRIVMLPKIRPHKLDEAVRLSLEYSQFEGFHQRILEKIHQCPVLIFQLFKRGILNFEEIKPFLKDFRSFLLHYYFHKEIDGFERIIKTMSKPYDFDVSIIKDESDIDLLIEFGFLPSSIEYILKYDVLDDLKCFRILDQEIKWSLFEWSMKPKHLDLLSFSGFFSSIKCFKHLLMNGFVINEKVISMVVCGGCFDIFHLCHNQRLFTFEIACIASEFGHLSLLAFLLENGVNTIKNRKSIALFFIILLLFIVLPRMVILVLLSIF